jgi:hypothetical protein
MSPEELKRLSNFLLLEEIVRIAFDKGVLAQKFRFIPYGSREWHVIDKKHGELSLTLGQLKVEYGVRFLEEKE